MKNSAYSIETYTFSSTDNLLFDCNIWMYLYGPVAAALDRRTQVYSSALAKVIAAKSTIFLDPLVLSEFVNRYSRLVFNTMPETARPRDFKTFRGSPHFIPVAQSIEGAVRQILRLCQKTDCGFELLDLIQLIGEFGKGKSDFNDQILTELCKSKGLTLVTHDGDFKGSGLKLLTANGRLLGR